MEAPKHYENLSPEDIATDLDVAPERLERLGSMGYRIQAELSGGGKNQIFKVRPLGERIPNYSMVAKFYNEKPGGPEGSDVMGLFREYSLLRFLQHQGLSPTPLAVERDFESRIGIYTFIEGEHKRAEDLTEADVEAMVDFILNLQSYKPNDVTASMPSEDKRCSLQDYFTGAAESLADVMAVRPMGEVEQGVAL